jgi:hypothetical protein
MKRSAIEQLARLAEARRLRDLARLEALAAERARLQTEIGDLARQAGSAAEGGLPFPLVESREAWLLAQIALRERRIAGIEREIEQARAEARQSVGKHEALKTLGKAARSAEAQARERGAERSAASMPRRNTPGTDG